MYLASLSQFLTAEYFDAAAQWVSAGALPGEWAKHPQAQNCYARIAISEVLYARHYVILTRA